mmetsp:Transcript_126864/g.290267  ORF Transcript_126864/g.290267 Transcript_126864/m.290267 type:complete len:203 (-) Transcript_126864:459-1067(-)
MQRSAACTTVPDTGATWSRGMAPTAACGLRPLVPARPPARDPHLVRTADHQRGRGGDTGHGRRGVRAEGPRWVPPGHQGRSHSGVQLARAAGAPTLQGGGAPEACCWWRGALEIRPGRAGGRLGLKSRFQSLTPGHLFVQRHLLLRGPLHRHTEQLPSLGRSGPLHCQLPPGFGQLQQELRIALPTLRSRHGPRDAGCTLHA